MTWFSHNSFLQHNPFVERQRRVERRSVHQFHRDGFALGRFFQAVYGGDVGMIQRRERLGFALKPSQPLRIPRQRRRHNLDRYFTVQFVIVGLVNLPHAPGPKGRQNCVRAEFVANRKRHEYEQVYRGWSENGLKSWMTRYSYKPLIQLFRLPTCQLRH